LRLFSIGGYGSALAALALVVFGAYDSYPNLSTEGVGGMRWHAVFSNFIKYKLISKNWRGSKK